MRRSLGMISSAAGVVVIIVAIVAIVAGSIFYYNHVYGQVTTVNYGKGIPSLSGFAVESLRITSPSGTTVQSGLVYVAQTQAQQIQGFQNVSSFGNCNNESRNSSSRCIGMIFVTSSTQNLCFWMHDTPLPLLQTWISSNGTVVYVYNAQPQSDNTVCYSAQFVLETLQNETISPGDVVTQGSL